MTRTYLPPGQPGFHLEYPPKGVIGDVLAGSARRYGDRVAIRDGDLSLTYTELYDAALSLAAGLRERGIGLGDVVSLHQPNSAWFTVTYFGVLLAGGVVTPTNPTLPPLALKEQLEEVGAAAVISHPSTVATVRAADPAGLRLTVVVESTEAAPGDMPAEVEDHVPLRDLLAHPPEPATAVSPDDLAHLSFTGGTTGVSKAVRLLHRNVVANALQTVCWRTGSRPVLDEEGGIGVEPIAEAATAYTGRRGDEASVAIAPLYHALGMAGQVGGVLAGGQTTMFGRFDSVRLARVIEERGITSMGGSPALFHALLAVPGIEEADLRSVRSILTGAAPIDAATQARIAEIFPNALITEGYGLTEATTVLTLHPLVGPDEVPEGSCGAPIFDTEISIRDASNGQELARDEVGEVWARGPQIADGYWNHPERTAEQFPGGWLRTGDLGRMDADGWLYLVGRAKDLIIYKGYNVYPAMLEGHLASHPAVAQASVIGVPDSDAGEIPVAYVMVRRDHEPSPDLAAELLEHVAARVAPYARLRGIEFIEGLPTTPSGKVLKTRLREMHVLTD